MTFPSEDLTDCPHTICMGTVDDDEYIIGSLRAPPDCRALLSAPYTHTTHLLSAGPPPRYRFAQLVGTRIPPKIPHFTLISPDLPQRLLRLHRPSSSVPLPPPSSLLRAPRCPQLPAPPPVRARPPPPLPPPRRACLLCSSGMCEAPLSQRALSIRSL
eukprot:SAG11_NODE_265_length_11509_cov_26.341455_2_plen_158_part_00